MSQHPTAFLSPPMVLRPRRGRATRQSMARESRSLESCPSSQRLSFLKSWSCVLGEAAPPGRAWPAKASRWKDVPAPDGFPFSTHGPASSARPRHPAVETRQATSSLFNPSIYHPSSTSAFICVHLRSSAFICVNLRLNSSCSDLRPPTLPSLASTARVAAMPHKKLIARITCDPAIFGGKPIIRGRRLAVEHILDMLAAGDDSPTILSGYPWLEPEDIQACLV